MIVVEHESLRAAAREIIAAGGSTGEEPTLVADHLVESNLTGHDSHGVGMLPRYVDNLSRGMLHPNRHVEVIRDFGAMVVVDGGMGYGQVVAREAIAIAIEHAEAHGLALVALRNAHHIGRVGAWGLQCANAGLVSMHYVNVIGHLPTVAPFRGSDARFSTNPYCCVLPATDRHPPVMLDMSTAKVAMGKVRVAMNKGERVVEGALIDAEGRPTTDPRVMFSDPRGALLPMGDHKGYGLAVICELLAGGLTGGGTSQPANTGADTIINNMLSIVIDPRRLTEASCFNDELDAMIDHIKGSPPTDPDAPVLVPGDPERAARAERVANGIPIDDVTWEGILTAAETLGLARAAITGLVAGR